MHNRIAGLVLVSILAWFLVATAPVAPSVAAVPEAEAASAAPDRPETTPASPDPGRQDGRTIARLRWVSPHGELPGTYAEYLKRHPLKPARFSNYRAMTSTAQPPASRAREPLRISILVDDDLYPAVLTALNEYVADLTTEGYSVVTETVSGGTPAEIKTWVQNRYAAGSRGVIFIGDITAAWAEVSGSVFPCDLFYMDLDGEWEDTDTDGDYDTHSAGTGDEGPELYLARLYAHTLNYDSEAAMVNAYFAKARAYRLGSLTQPWRGLEYVDEDWYSMDVALRHVYDDHLVRYDFGYFTTATDYLDQMDLGQHFVQVCAHSYSGGHHFGRRPTESAAYAHVYLHSPAARTAKLLYGCDDGIKIWLNGNHVVTRDRYAGWNPDQFTADVNLLGGWNQLLCKISQDGGDYLLSARFTDGGGTSFTDLTYQLDDPDTHGPAAQFVRGWLLNGFHQDSSDNFWNYLSTNYLGADHGALNPLEGEVHGGQTWTAHSGNGGFVDLGEYCGGADFGVCYAFVRIYADADVSCQLWSGYEDGARVWLNGARILDDNRYGSFQVDMTKLDVNLVSGENRLLFKVSEWMGSHGFSARFCYSDGSPVENLSYDPQPDPVSYIGDWLLNGPYANADHLTRLSQDYLGGEVTVRPSEGDPAPFGTWQPVISSGYPCDLGVFYDDSDDEWVYSQTIQDRDPPVLFYNLFSCGPGRFTDDNYLAGAYIFNTTYGLITVASAKSGSMLNFQDFTHPLGEGKTMGSAFREWFEAQAPFEQWEREWYYGMVLNGLPTLRPLTPGDLDLDGDVDLNDFATFAMCYSSATVTSPPPGCETFSFVRADLDDDEDVDLNDFATFALNFTG